MAMLIGRRLFNNRLLNSIQKRHGYIVLVPEIGEDLPENNALLQEDGLPQFSNVTIEHCMAAIGKQTTEFEAAVKNIEASLQVRSKVDTLKDAINPLEILSSPLDMTWGISKTLYLGNSSLMPTKSYMAMHERAKRARASKYHSNLIYKSASDSLKNVNPNSEEERVLKKYILEGKLNGVHLNESSKAKLNNNLNKLADERGKFKIKIDTSTKKFMHKITDPNLMHEMPNYLASSMSMNPADNQGPWMLTLQPQIYKHFMRLCPDRELRWNTWHALVSRGSGYGNKEFETSTHIEEIRFLRHDQAKILGYDTYAEVSMETKMAGNVDTITNTIDTLLTQAKPIQDKEVEDLYQFALEQGFTGSQLELWDVDFWRYRQAQALYDFDEEKIQEYFPLGKVLSGLFELCESLFNIRIKQRQNISGWHKDVKFYDVFESHSSAPVAGFYIDPYAQYDGMTHLRENNGWMVGIQNHSRIAETKPLAALIFNFQPSTPDKPSLLTFRDVKRLFHKFGQTLQHVLSRTTYSEVSGLSNIEWDAVDVSGHVLSSWLYNESTIEKLSSHYLSEDKLPTHMFNALVNMRKHCAGIDLCKELYLSALDLELYSSRDFWLECAKRLWPQYRSFKLHKPDSHVTSFSDIFCEEWSAAYYSHLWSKMIAADVYSAFHEVQGQEKQIVDVGKRYRDTFLALGGSCHPSQVFRNFRGRDPSPKALLASLGLKRLKNE